MGQSKPFRATALIVEDDPMQRDMICLLLEESAVDVIECESAEAAELVLERAAGNLVLMMTDVQLAGNMDGVELAHIASFCMGDDQFPVRLRDRAGIAQGQRVVLRRKPLLLPRPPPAATASPRG